MSTFSQSFGDALGPAIGTLVVYILLAALAVFAAIVVFGGIFLALAVIFYKKKRKKTFLVFAFLSDVFLSLLAALIARGISGGTGGMMVAAWAVFFLVGLFLTIRYYKK
ncbi:MAG: hypothetical protein HYS73_00120 [Parcubacteria group bacterium]|nr:hypothetical protein [Parcubacteria group bacterium]